MNLDQFYPGQNEKPLDHLVPGGGMSCILRTIGCVGDSLASGEFESLDENGKKDTMTTLNIPGDSLWLVKSAARFTIFQEAA